LNTGKVSRSQAAVRALKLQTKFPAGHVHRNRRNPTAARTTCWRARSVQFWGWATRRPWRPSRPG